MGLGSADRNCDDSWEEWKGKAGTKGTAGRREITAEEFPPPSTLAGSVAGEGRVRGEKGTNRLGGQGPARGGAGPRPRSAGNRVSSGCRRDSYLSGDLGRSCRAAAGADRGSDHQTNAPGAPEDCRSATATGGGDIAMAAETALGGVAG